MSMKQLSLTSTFCLGPIPILGSVDFNRQLVPSWLKRIMKLLVIHYGYIYMDGSSARIVYKTVGERPVTILLFYSESVRLVRLIPRNC